MQFLILVLLLLFEGIAIPKLQNDAAYFSLDPELIKGNTFRSHELTTDLIQAMRKSEEPARIAGVYLLEQQFHPGQGDVFGSEDDLLRKTIPWQKSLLILPTWQPARKSGRTCAIFRSCSGKKNRI